MIQTKPDAIDDDAIQQLVNKFLNTGEGGEESQEKVNKNALSLINSSSYWSNEAAVSFFFHNFLVL